MSEAIYNDKNCLPQANNWGLVRNSCSSAAGYWNNYFRLNPNFCGLFFVFFQGPSQFSGYFRDLFRGISHFGGLSGFSGVSEVSGHPAVGGCYLLIIVQKGPT